MYKLTKSQFADAIKKGLGRAVLCLQQSRSTMYHDQILDAILESSAYDLQCEGHRPEYFYDVIKHSCELEFFVGEAMQSLGSAQDERLRDQLSELIVYTAKQGHEDLRRWIYEQFDQINVADSLCPGIDVIKLDGLAGLLYVADRIGGSLDPEECWRVSIEIANLKEELGDEAIENALREAANRNVRIRGFLDVKDVTIPPRNPIPIESYADLLHGPYRNKLYSAWRWAKTASESDLVKAANDFLAEEDPKKLRLFSRIFRKRKFPLDSNLLIARARHPNSAIAIAALSVLRHEELVAPAIRGIAMDFITANYLIAESIELLEYNYLPGDNSMIEAALERATLADQDVVHGIGLALLSVFGKGLERNGLRSLSWLYEYGPCSLCRLGAVERLFLDRIAPESMVVECMHDCQLDTRKLAQSVLNS